MRTRPARPYNFQGLAGCVTQKRARLTGTLVAIYHAAQAGLDENGGPWVTTCEDHSTLVNLATLDAARRQMPDPTGWCGECREAEVQKVTTRGLRAGSWWLHKKNAKTVEIITADESLVEYSYVSGIRRAPRSMPVAAFLETFELRSLGEP